MATKRKPREIQESIPDRLLPLEITTASITNPRTGKPTAACSEILAAIGRIAGFQAAQGKSLVTVTVTVTAAQRELLRDNHRDYPRRTAFNDEADYKAACEAFRARRMFVGGIELVTP